MPPVNEMKSDNIPKWAKKLTEEVMESYLNTDMTVDDAIFVAVFNAIHDARAEAYEECAKIAETIYGDDKDALTVSEYRILRDVADAIRSKANQ